MELEWLQLILGFVGGGFVSLLTIPSVIKKSKAEARAVEIDNLQKACDGWKELADERQEANREKDERIKELTRQVDERYADIGMWRDKYNAQQDEITELRVYKATNEVKLCMKRGCQDREPQSGY